MKIIQKKSGIYDSKLNVIDVYIIYRELSLLQMCLFYRTMM